MAQVSRCSCELQGGHFYAVLFVSRSGVAGIANHNKHHPNDGSRTSPARQVLEVVSVGLLVAVWAQDTRRRRRWAGDWPLPISVKPNHKLHPCRRTGADATRWQH